MAGPTLDDIHAAAHRLEGRARRTPLLSSPFVDEVAGRRVLVKPECLQHGGAFKFRGAWNAVAGRIDAGERPDGLIAYSSGNHAQGVALAAKGHGLSAVIVMPSDAPSLKIENTRALGAEVVLYDRENESREEIGAALAQERGLTLIKPYDDPLVIAGQGTVGLEIGADHSGDAEVLVCCGGGGLTAGIALALEGRMTVRPVEPVGFDDVARSMASGQRETNPRATGSICDAVLTPAPGDITFPILQRLCGPALAVTDEDALRAMALAFLRLKLVVEPGGAVALAAALTATDLPDTVIVTLSGGNVDPAIFARALASL